MAALGFVFFYFIFLKIYCSIAFDTGISLVAALIAAVVVSGIEIVPAMFFRKALISARMESITGRPSDGDIFQLWLSYVLVVPFMVAAVILITVGFSEKFFDDELTGRYRDFLRLDWVAIIVLLFGVFIMTLPHMIMTHLGLKAVARDDF